MNIFQLEFKAKKYRNIGIIEGYGNKARQISRLSPAVNRLSFRREIDAEFDYLRTIG